MGRSGYSEDGDGDDWQSIMAAGASASAARGSRGQKFLREMLAALDAMPVKRLIADELQVPAPAFIPPDFVTCEVCALGALGQHRGMDLASVHPEDHERLAQLFDIAPTLVRDVEWTNDEGYLWSQTPEQRWHYVRAWVERRIKKEFTDAR